VKSRFVVTIIVLLVFSSLAYSDDPLTTGKAAFEKGDVQTAIKDFRDATQKDKRSPDAFIWLGRALLKADSLDQAVAALVQARELDTADASTYELLGDVYWKQHIPAAAADQYKKAVELKKDAGTYLKLANAYKKTRLYTEAANAYLNVLAIDSLDVPALEQLGSIYSRAKLYPQALGVLERLYPLETDSLNTAIEYVKALSETGHDSELIPIAEMILQRDASQSEIESMLAKAYNNTGRTAKVIEVYSKRDPDSLSEDELIRFGKALRSVDSLDKAIDIYNRAYQRDTTRCEIFYDFGTLYMRAKRYEDAVNMFGKKIACDTNAGYQFASHLNAAMCLMQLKQFKEAREHIQKSIDLRPDNVLSWISLARDDAQLSDTKAELEAYAKVIELANAAEANGEQGKYTMELEEAYRITGIQLLIDKKYADAIPYLTKALKLNPKSCNTALLIGQAYHNSKLPNKEEEAKKWYCKVLQACPKSKEAQDAETGLKLLGEECK
jgi:tetratricopeptide (TPR) repeat protein